MTPAFAQKDRNCGLDEYPAPREEKTMADDAPVIVKTLAQSYALITGGTAGVGFATARQLLEAGVPKVVIVGRNAERGAAAAKALGGLGEVHFLVGDASQPAEAQRIAAQAHAAMGAIDILLNSTAPNALPELLHRTDLAIIPDILAQLALPPLLMTAAVLPYMRAQKSGVILNIASDAAKSATPGEAVIGGGMAAIVMFSRTVALEAKRDGIRVNALTPSLISGTLTSERILKEGFSQRLFEKAGGMASLGIAEADDIAALAVFLASPAAAKLTGQAISVNGGISAA